MMQDAKRAEEENINLILKDQSPITIEKSE